uniref:Type II toxin-antitoxin system RelE/ParE family toxin n=1 Tax=Chlorobium chlorochromatii (strain CaD3) TaxID=340177 RepID=Q3APL2_CHLCH
MPSCVYSADEGLIDTDYGGGVIKQRIPRQGEGKSGGLRSIILYKKADKAFFVYGFAKNAQQNIKDSEVKGFKKLAKNIFELTDTQLEKLIISKEFTRVQCHEE